MWCRKGMQVNLSTKRTSYRWKNNDSAQQRPSSLHYAKQFTIVPIWQVEWYKGGPNLDVWRDRQISAWSRPRMLSRDISANLGKF